MNTLKKDLINKIKLQRGVHSYFERKCKFQSILIKTILIIFPAFLAFIAFSDYNFLKLYYPNLTNDDIRMIIGVISLILFLAGVISEIYNISIKHERHRDAIEQYSELLRKFKELSGEISSDQIKLLNQRYISISTNTSHISSKKFIKAEKYYLKSLALRKAIKENPFRMPWNIRKRAMQLYTNKSKPRS